MTKNTQPLLALVMGYSVACADPTVVPAPASIELVSSAPGPLVVDTSLPITVRVVDAARVPIAAALVRFSAQASSVFPDEARTDVNGLASTVWRIGVRPGAHTLHVTLSGMSELALRISGESSAGPPHTIVVSPDTLRILQGLQYTFSVNVYDAHGNTVTGANIQWHSADSTIVAVSATGVALGRRAGEALITAQSGAAAGSTVVQVYVPSTWQRAHSHGAEGR